MPIFILFVGVLLIAAGINNKLGNLKTLIVEDFSPSNGATPFQLWIVAIVIAGSVGYIKGLRPISNALLLLIFVALFVKKDQGFFDQFINAIKGNSNG